MGVADVDHLRADEVSRRRIHGRHLLFHFFRSTMDVLRSAFNVMFILQAVSVAARQFLRAPCLMSLIAMAPSVAAYAHNPDTSYARVRITPDWLELRFTYDLDVLDRAFAIDANADGSITADEFRENGPKLIRFLRQAIELQINDYPADFGDAEPTVWPSDGIVVGPGDRQSTLVHVPFRKRIQELPESVTLNFRIFDAVGDTHTVLGTFHQPPYPEYEVVFTRFEPDFLFFTDVEPSVWGHAAEFFKLGMKHIFLGYDHILFLLALLVVDRLGTVVKIVTSFTVAHSLTLMLAALQVVALPSRFIESAIAATIVYVAIENLWVKDTHHRWWLTFAFGLIHGFGFANVLRELGLPAAGLARSLIAFNLGVEAGQLAIVATVWPLWRLGANRPWGVWLARGSSVAIGICGLLWLLDRTFGMAFMPF